MKQYCLTLDLKDDPRLIEEYVEHHKKVWPEVTSFIKDSGINKMEIFLLHNRLVMTIETRDDFSFERMDESARENPKVQEWENLMWKFQQAITGSPKGAKWILMDKIYQLEILT